MNGALDRAQVAESDRLSRIAEILGRAGFTDLDAEASTLSGGWRKRLAIVEALVQQPEHFAARRADKPSGPCGNQVAGNTLAKCAVRLRDRQPRPLFPGKRRERRRGTESRPMKMARCASWKLQHLSGSQRGISACAEKSPGGS